jgi:hypothetical protein
MDKLFAVDAEARRKAMTTAARHVRRQETARLLLDDIRKKTEAAQSIALPSSALSKACQYVLALWKKLTRFLEYPELELSTNLAENSMRPVALGRKNWIHIGSPQAGPKVAAILSVVESCRRLKISVRDYLAAILPGLVDVSIRQLPALLPPLGPPLSKPDGFPFRLPCGEAVQNTPQEMRHKRFFCKVTFAEPLVYMLFVPESAFTQRRTHLLITNSDEGYGFNKNSFD